MFAPPQPAGPCSYFPCPTEPATIPICKGLSWFALGRLELAHVSGWRGCARGERPMHTKAACSGRTRAHSEAIAGATCTKSPSMLTMSGPPVGINTSAARAAHTARNAAAEEQTRPGRRRPCRNPSAPAHPPAHIQHRCSRVRDWPSGHGQVLGTSPGLHPSQHAPESATHESAPWAPAQR